MFACLAHRSIIHGINEKPIIPEITTTFLADKTSRGVPRLSHSIENLVQDRFTTLGAFGGIFVFIASFAPGILVADDERGSRSKRIAASSAKKKWPG